MIDTVIGCAIAFIISLIVFPVWEYEQTKELISKLINANKKYFNAAASLLMSNSMQEDVYKPARKEAFVALANLSDNFQRILIRKKKAYKSCFLSPVCFQQLHAYGAHCFVIIFNKKI